MKETRDLKVNINRSGSGGYSGKITLPITWLRDMNITEENREVRVTYDKELKEIIIEKAPKPKKTHFHIDDLLFQYRDLDRNEEKTLDFMQLCEEFDGYLEYDPEIDVLIFTTDEEDRYEYQVTNGKTTIAEIQEFIDNTLKSEQIDNILYINVLEKEMEKEL